ncbi:MAG TPA: hypothetical protein VIY48_05835 [Candidatus Paceibacterota bacterium]
MLACSDNPIITCTVKQLAFAAWQKCRGNHSLLATGDSWNEFQQFWLSHKFESTLDACAKAWTGLGFGEWWLTILKAQPVIGLTK